MNWGYKILIVIIVFIITMLSMVFVAFRQTNEMMDEGYYQKELKYQSYIDGSKNLNSITIETLLKQTESGVVLEIPTSLVVGFESGNIELLKNDNQKKDLNINFTPDENGLFFMDKSQFTNGRYTARIQWVSKGKSYYREQPIDIK